MRKPSELFAQKVRETRHARGWEQSDLARRLLELQGIAETPKTLNSWRVLVGRTESGKRKPSLDDSFLFAAALGVQRSALLYERTSEAEVEIAPQVALPAGVVRAWEAGECPLRPEDADSYARNFLSPWDRPYIKQLVEAALESGKPPASQAVADALRGHCVYRHWDLHNWLRRIERDDNPVRKAEQLEGLAEEERMIRRLATALGLPEPPPIVTATEGGDDGDR